MRGEVGREMIWEKRRGASKRGEREGGRKGRSELENLKSLFSHLDARKGRRVYALPTQTYLDT